MAPMPDNEPVPEEPVLRERELDLLKEARGWGLGREFGGVASDLHLLALMQHHGVPTRLLDVTSNPMTAIWFACQTAGGGRDAGAQRVRRLRDSHHSPSAGSMRGTYP